ncbi:GTPase domain-containing protein [Zavarzinella formosa]|uniref:GTPase domain-containing protein n=1 Tax=Zavarzinella formosa TaxID=360055 RepID=UPI000306A331|nr:GTPase domain-containing protein [Zavarzinella formosa]
MANNMANVENSQRIVVFGMPDAGKSSLLGALAQVGLTQSRSLGGHLHEGGGLANLRHQVYEEHTRETQQEIVSYPIHIAGTGPKHPSRNAVVIDCDGRAVNDILTKKNSINQSQNAKQLAEAILTADSLVFVIDAGAPYDLQDRDFHEFARFLKHFESKRANEHGVGGLPVFLVLSKCDKIAGPNMNSGEWQRIIEARCNEAAHRFREVLKEEPTDADDYWKFGSIDFHVRPCAVKRPRLTDFPEQPREPYGVAELFNEVFGDAAGYRDRTEKSKNLLSWILAGISGLLGTLALSGSFLFLNPVSDTTPIHGLSSKVDTLQASEAQGAPARLAADILPKRLKLFQDIQNDPEFDRLSELQKNYVRLRLDEGQAYLKFLEELNAVPPMSKSHSLAELNDIEKRLNKTSVPAAYRSEWVGTDAVLLRERLLTKDIVQLKEAVNTLINHFQALKNRGSALLLETTELSPEWKRKGQELVEEGEKSRPFPKADPLLGPAYVFDEVVFAENDWLKFQLRLAHVQDMATALGLLGNMDATAPLAPVMNSSAKDVIVTAATRYGNLKNQYPDYNRWTLADMPDKLRHDFQRVLKKSNDELIRDGQRLMLTKLKPTAGGETTELASKWPGVVEYILSDREVQDWKKLTDFICRLYDPTNPTIVESTAEFLGEKTFKFEFKRMSVKIPDIVLNGEARPVGDLVISCRKTETSEPQKVTLSRDGEPKRDSQSSVFMFTTNEPVLKIDAGDIVFAELLVKKPGGTEQKLTWNTFRTPTYQFESLKAPPKLHDPKTPAAKGVMEDGVTLDILDGKYTPVPAMLPSLR